MEMTNFDRAERAGDAVAAYVAYDSGSEYQHEDAETHLGDLLCDLQHWCDDSGANFEVALKNARNNYLAEYNEARECPECETNLDEDGYCVDAGCKNVGKAVDG